MPPRLRQQILVLAVLIGLVGVLAPALALTRDGADSGVRIVHQTIGLSQTDLRDPDAVGAAVSQFAGSVYGPSAASASARTPLSQFTGAMGAQAQQERWVSLVLDVWVGGNASPVGYYVRYEGRRAAGDLVQGESFLTFPDEPGKPHLAPYAGLMGWMTDAYAGLARKPERLLDGGR